MERKREMKVNEVWGEGPDINGKDTRGQKPQKVKPEHQKEKENRKRKQELTIKGRFGETVNK